MQNYLASSSPLQHIPELGCLGGMVRVATHAGGIHCHILLLAEVDSLTCWGGGIGLGGLSHVETHLHSLKLC